MKTKRVLLIFVLALTVLALLLALGVALINWHVYQSAEDRILDDYSDRDPYDCILVLGAGLRADGTPSDMLEDRLKRGIELYQMGAAPIILLSGDCSGLEYDEVGAMEFYCLAAGIPQEAILRDDEGFSTRESMENLTEREGFERVIVVTQSYHLYRAVFIARGLGLEADGYSADLRSYRGQIFREIREIAARCKDFLGVSFS